MNMKPFLLAFALVLYLTSPAMAGDSAFWGTGMGAALGGFLGSQIGRGSGQLAATGAGVFLGGVIGNSIGSSMDRADAAYYGGSAGSFSPYPSYSTYEPNYVGPEGPTPPRLVYVEPEIVEYRRVRTPVYVEEGYVGAPAPRAEESEPEERHCREFTQKIKIDGKVHESFGTACLRPDGTWHIENE